MTARPLRSLPGSTALSVQLLALALAHPRSFPIGVATPPCLPCSPSLPALRTAHPLGRPRRRRRHQPCAALRTPPSHAEQQGSGHLLLKETRQLRSRVDHQSAASAAVTTTYAAAPWITKASTGGSLEGRR